MKKLYYFLAVMLLTLVSVGVTSCGDDKDEPKSSDLVGSSKPLMKTVHPSRLWFSSPRTVNGIQ